MELSQKLKIICDFFIFFFAFSTFRFSFEHIADVFLDLGTPKTWLDKCLRSLVSEVPSISNMVKGPKYCSKLNDRTFTIFIDPCK